MRKLIVLVIGITTASALSAQTAHEVRGYTRSDGTYVAPHYQSNPDATRLNNYSSEPNINPYTGQAGTVNPYTPKPSENPYGYHPHKPN